MEENDKNYPKRQHSRVWPGLLILAAGGLLLAREMSADIPDWLFSWPVLIIAIGIIIGIQHGFRNIAWLVLIGVGAFFLLSSQLPDLRLHRYLYPIMLMLLGLFFIFRRRNEWADKQRLQWKNSWRGAKYGGLSSTNEGGEFIDSTSIFGGVKKVVLSKDFKGGDITCIMGGAEIDLSQADIQGTAVLDVTQIFGGTKLVVPGNWNVKTNLSSIFAGIDDKRNLPAVADPNKTLIIDGTSIFAGIEITSYPTRP
jgi:predicted membrane protein